MTQPFPSFSLFFYCFFFIFQIFIVLIFVFFHVSFFPCFFLPFFVFSSFFIFLFFCFSSPHQCPRCFFPNKKVVAPVPGSSFLQVGGGGGQRGRRGGVGEPRPRRPVVGQGHEEESGAVAVGLRGGVDAASRNPSAGGLRYSHVGGPDRESCAACERGVCVRAWSSAVAVAG